MNKTLLPTTSHKVNITSALRSKCFIYIPCVFYFYILCVMFTTIHITILFSPISVITTKTIGRFILCQAITTAPYLHWHSMMIEIHLKCRVSSHLNRHQISFHVLYCCVVISNIFHMPVSCFSWLVHYLNTQYAISASKCSSHTPNRTNQWYLPALINNIASLESTETKCI